MFTFVNSELRNFSSDKVTHKLLIINDLRCHLSLVTFAFTLSFDVLCLFFWVWFYWIYDKNDIVNSRYSTRTNAEIVSIRVLF